MRYLMKATVFMGALAAAGLAAGLAGAATLDDVKAKGHLQCGISRARPASRSRTHSGEWDGFDVDMCRAVAAAIFGDPNAIAVHADDRQDAVHRAGLGRGRRALPQHHLDVRAATPT